MRNLNLILILISTLIFGCAFPHSHPSINASYEGHYNFTATSSIETILAKSLIKDKEKGSVEDYVIQGRIENMIMAFGSASKDDSISRSMNGNFKGQGKYLMYYIGGDTFKYTTTTTGEYRITTKRICSFSCDGEGKIYNTTVFENGKITLICNDGVYNGTYYFQGEREKSVNKNQE